MVHEIGLVDDHFTKNTEKNEKNNKIVHISRQLFFHTWLFLSGQ